MMSKQLRLMALFSGVISLVGAHVSVAAPQAESTVPSPKPSVKPSPFVLKYAKELIRGGVPVKRPKDATALKRGEVVKGQMKEQPKGMLPAKACFELTQSGVSSAPTTTAGKSAKRSYDLSLSFKQGATPGVFVPEAGLIVSLSSRAPVSLSPSTLFAKQWTTAQSTTPGRIAIRAERQGSAPALIRGSARFHLCKDATTKTGCKREACDFSFALQ